MEVVGRLRVRTENNCVACDIAQIGNYLLFGYNMFIGLKTETHEEPHLFSFEPVQRSRFNPRSWATAKFNLILWCDTY